MTVEVVAHRGASAYAAEHSFAAYDLALDQGADMLELDVRATADGQLVVLHDATLLRTTGDPRRIGEVTGADLDGLGPSRPLRLDAVLDRYGHDTRYLVELKDPEPAWELRVAAALDRRSLADRAVVQSFDAAALQRIRAEAPWTMVAPLARRPLRVGRWLDAAADYATAVGVWHRTLDASIVGAAHARGLAVRAWTPNQPEDIDRMLALGVDGIITDVPDVARALVSGDDAVAATPLAA